MSVHALIERTDIRSAFCTEDISLFEAAEKLVKLNVNALAVTSNRGTLRGIITEHDILRTIVDFIKTDGWLDDLHVGRWMTENVITCDVNAKFTEAMDLMGKHRIRHLVVMSGGKLLGVLGIKDVLESIHKNDALEANVLRDIALVARGSSR